MSYVNRSFSTTSARTKPLPWLVFLFIAAVFFVSFNNLAMSKRGTIAFNATEGEILTVVNEGQLSKQIAFVCLGLFSVVSLYRHRGERLRLEGCLGWSLLFFLGWASLSLAWTGDPALTLRRLIFLLMVTLGAVATARRFPLRDIIMLTFFCSALFLLTGVVAELLLGTFQPFMPGYRFA